ncbi:hypothetical protein MKX73_19095 [Solibacillus sp. FSL W7-1436]|uniref:hypothetical protein n=1 Tax=Solibacillus sp. FSL W7-1436 TaxID=2921705 RepID=UPI0030FB8C2A
MKLVLCLRSNAAYENAAKSLSLSKRLNDLTIAKENITTVELLKDFIEFYEADLYILDAAVPNVSEMKTLLEKSNKKYVYVEAIKEITPTIEEKFGEEQIEEKEILPQAVIAELPNHKHKPRIIEIEKEVVVSKYRTVPKKVILIGSLYSNAGSTIVATNLARALAEREVDVTYIENPIAEPNMYDFLQVHTAYPEYVDLGNEIINDRFPKNYEPYFHKGINWVLNDPRNKRNESITFEHLTLMKQFVEATVVIYDISNYMDHPEIIKLARIANEIILVAEANPIKNEYHFTNPDRTKNVVTLLEKNEIDYKIFLTKTGIKGIDMKVINELLPVPATYEMTYIPYEELIENLFKSQIYYDADTEAQLFIEEELTPLIENLLPIEIAKLKKKPQKTLISRLFKRSI